jgi:hypothetical protein
VRASSILDLSLEELDDFIISEAEFMVHLDSSRERENISIL